MSITKRMAVVISALAFTGAAAATMGGTAQAVTVGTHAMTAPGHPMFGGGGSFIVEDDDFFLFEDDGDGDCF